MASVLAAKFFSGLDPSLSFIFALLTFGVGFVVRPFGAIVFGRLGDLIGRKRTFMITIVIMGLATFAVGLLPIYETAGVAAPIMLVALPRRPSIIRGSIVRLRRRPMFWSET